jgi:uncharacterized protein YukE
MGLLVSPDARRLPYLAGAIGMQEAHTMSGSREKLDELRSKARELHQAREELDTLLGQLGRQMSSLMEHWSAPAASEMQAAISGVIRQTQGINETLGAVEQDLDKAADQAEQYEQAADAQASDGDA